VTDSTFVLLIKSDKKTVGYQFLIIYFLLVLNTAFAQQTSSYVLFDTSWFDTALSESQKALGNENVHISKNEGVDGYIAKIEKDLANGKIRPGDQVMLQIFTHGHPNSGEISHKLNIDGENNLDLIVPLRQKLEDAGIRVAILDGSCFSGNSLALGGPNTCVISSQSRAFEAAAQGKYGDQNGTFIEAMWEHRNEKGISSLSDIFIEARADVRNQKIYRSNRPEISEPFYVALREHFDQWFNGYQLRFDRINSLNDILELNIQNMQDDKFYCDIDLTNILASRFYSENQKSEMEQSSQQVNFNELSLTVIYQAFEDIRQSLIEFYKADQKLTIQKDLFDKELDLYQQLTDPTEKSKRHKEVMDPIKTKLDKLRDSRNKFEQQVIDHETALYNLLQKKQSKQTPCSQFII
jgi:hypothetical protein